MMSELMLGILFDLAKNGVITGISVIFQRNFESALQETLREFEDRSYVSSRTDLGNFLKSPEFESHLELHMQDRKLDFEYLGNILLEYANIPREFSGFS